jgi:hypothetical protein
MKHQPGLRNRAQRFLRFVVQAWAKRRPRYCARPAGGHRCCALVHVDRSVRQLVVLCSVVQVVSRPPGNRQLCLSVLAPVGKWDSIKYNATNEHHVCISCGTRMCKIEDTYAANNFTNNFTTEMASPACSGTINGASTVGISDLKISCGQQLRNKYTKRQQIHAAEPSHPLHRASKSRPQQQQNFLSSCYWPVASPSREQLHFKGFTKMSNMRTIRSPLNHDQ